MATSVVSGGPETEAGVTLVELMVAIGIFVVALALVLPTYLILAHSSNSTAVMTTEDSAVVPALRQLSLQVANSTVLSSPCASGANADTPPCQGGTGGNPPSGFAVLMYYNYFSGGTGIGLCSQWRVHGGLLQSRSWLPSSSAPTAFATQASGVRVANTTSPWQPPFALEGNSGTKARTLDVDLEVQASPSLPAQEIKTSVASLAVAPLSGSASQPVCTPPPSQ